MVEREGVDLRHDARPGRRVRRCRARDGGGHFGDALAVQVHHRVELSHAPVVERSLEGLTEPRPRARESLGHVPAGQEHRRVVREEAPIVPEDPKSQALELPVRREDVHDIHLAAGERPVRQGVLHHPYASQRQAVVAPESRPAVLALQKT